MRKLFWIFPFVLIFRGAADPQAFSQSLNRPFFIRGEVRDSAEHPMAEASVCVRQGQKRLCAPTDRDGRFTMRLVEGGSYKVSLANVPTRLVAGLFMPSDEYPASIAESITLDSANPEARVSLTMPPRNGIIFFKAADSGSHLPVDLVRVQVCQAETLSCGGMFYRNDAGEFKIYVPPTPFNLRIASPDYQEWIMIGGQEAVVSPGTSRDLRVEMQPLSRAIGSPGVALAAPRLLSPVENQRFDHYPRTITLKWEAVAGAASYAVEVVYCQYSQSPSDCRQPAPMVFSFPADPGMKPNTTAETNYTFDFIGSQPGRWRVWAVDNDGRKGLKSLWRVFSYAR